MAGDLGRTDEAGLAGRKLQNRGRQSVRSESRIKLQQRIDARRLRSEHKPRNNSRITADIVDSAAAGLSLVSNVQWVMIGIGEDALNRAHFAQPAGGDNFAHSLPLRMMPHHERFLDLASGTVTHVKQCFGFSRRQRNRFFAKNVLACLKCPHRPRHVQMVGQRIVDCVYGIIIEELPVAPVTARNVQRGGRGLRARRVTGGNRLYRAMFACLHGRDDFLGSDARDTQNSPPDRRHSLLPPYLSHPA